MRRGCAKLSFETRAFRRSVFLRSPQVKEEKAEIHWGDETGVQTGANRVRGFAPKGEKPVVNLVVKKSHVSMISSITNQGKVRFMMYQDAMNSEILINFMTRLTKDAGRKVFLILDNLRVHHGKNVKQWLEEHQEQMEIFYLPSYSPELLHRQLNIAIQAILLQ